MAPQTPQRAERPGEAVALRDYRYFYRLRASAGAPHATERIDLADGSGSNTGSLRSAERSAAM
jgi:hypothetical protein